MADPAGTVSIVVRWSDVDANSHVNNATYMTYLEEGRDAFFVAAGIRRADTALARCEVDFLEPIPLDAGRIECSVELRHVGRSSIETAERISGSATTYATARSVSVHVGEDGRPRALSDVLRGRLGARGARG
jgi:acyl-CoA thioester hydrolase